MDISKIITKKGLLLSDSTSEELPMAEIKDRLKITWNQLDSILFTGEEVEVDGVKYTVDII